MLFPYILCDLFDNQSLSFICGILTVQPCRPIVNHALLCVGVFNRGVIVSDKVWLNTKGERIYTQERSISHQIQKVQYEELGRHQDMSKLNVCVASCLPRYFNLEGFWKYRCPFTSYNIPQSYACGLADNEMNKKQLKEFYLEMSLLTAQFLQRNKLCRHQKSACLYLKLIWIHFRSLDMSLCLRSLSETSFPFEELSYTNIIDFSFDSGIYMHKRVLVLKAMLNEGLYS